MRSWRLVGQIGDYRGFHDRAFCRHLRQEWPHTKYLDKKLLVRGGQAVAELGVGLYPADRLAEDTMRGLERNKAVPVIPSGAHRYWLMTRLMPGLVERQTLAVTRSMRKKVGQPGPARGATQPV